MKLPVIPGLIALQLAAALTASAQNYYIKLTGDHGTRVADHGAWEQGIPANFDESIEAYNVEVSGGGNGIGLMRFNGPAGTYSWAVHHRLNAAPEEVEARRILTPQYNNMLYVIGEKYGIGPKSAVVLQYDASNGHLTAANHLPALPQGYSLIRVYDVISEPDFQNRMRILCRVSDGSAESIMELLYDASSNTYRVKNYKPDNIAPDRYASAYYVRAYHYGNFNLGDVSFYGLATYSNERVAYCYTENKYEMYQLQSLTGAKGIFGVQMNGSYGADGTHRRIDMAFIDRDGALCMQQKDELTTLNWRRFYQLPRGSKFEMGYGRDGHGTKQGGGMDYFMATTHFPGDANSDGHVTSLHYDAFNGNLNKPNVYNLSGIGVQKDGGFPNTTYDPHNRYTFIADRFNRLNGFKFGISNASYDGEIPCTKPVSFREFKNDLSEKLDDMHIEEYGPFDAESIEMAEAEITVDIVEECNVEQRGAATNSNLLQGSSNLYMDATQLRLEATGKTISAMRVLSIDGRLIAEQHNLNSNRYEQHFNTPLVPGIYVISLEFADHSRENRKISVH
ncbi:hypothetical protein [Taibaiella chishuiensis]|uniref:Secreted protein (Por secretion system target) n=1 Tax=Taibaiella chishuiensis TaxID=1434707 RepID=A0A2P8CX52_9BACT|nr:hypothetical protein [Taibaiella chishuiensis]PSK89529.1 hypothetical protein B0I18_11184 [Taibaiella chishuiensis]